MAIERTLSIIKPDGVQKGVIGKVIAHFEEKGLKPVAVRMQHLSKAEAEGFYAVHKERPFFKSLVEFMTSGPVVVMALEGEGAVAKNREITLAADRGILRRCDVAQRVSPAVVEGILILDLSCNRHDVCCRITP